MAALYRNKYIQTKTRLFTERTISNTNKDFLKIVTGLDLFINAPLCTGVEIWFLSLSRVLLITSKAKGKSKK